MLINSQHLEIIISSARHLTHCTLFTFPLHYKDMKIDTQWFKDRITETPQGSMRGVAPLIKGPKGPLDVAQLSRIINGTQSIRLEDVKEIATALGVSPVDVLIRAGCLKPSDVRGWRG